MSRPRNAEFALLVACCRWPLTLAARRAIERRARAVDWTRFVRLAMRHRVEGVAWRGLAAAGIELEPIERKQLADAATRIAHQNLALAAESIQLSRMLQGAGVAHIFVKGVTLGKLAYGDIARKAGWDIDLLIAPDDLEEAAALLRTRGYTLDTPVVKAAPERLAIWHRHSKESIWRSADATIWVELHTALADNPILLPGIGPTSARALVEVSPGLALPTLARDELVAYLCVHGASSAWFRLKWIADFAALIGNEPAEEVERLYRRAIELGAGRTAAVALLLARLLFRPAISPQLWRELRSDRVTRWLVSVALRKLTGRTREVELDDVVMGTASIHLAQLGSLPTWRYKRAELLRQLVSPIDRVATPLPRALTWLYPAVQAVRLIRGRSES